MGYPNTVAYNVRLVTSPMRIPKEEYGLFVYRQDDRFSFCKEASDSPIGYKRATATDAECEAHSCVKGQETEPIREYTKKAYTTKDMRKDVSPSSQSPSGVCGIAHNGALAEMVNAVD